MALSHSPSIVTSGLVYCSDPLNLRSYPGSGTTLYDVSGSGSTGTLTNGPTYSSGYLTYDGVDDRVVTTASPNYPSTTWEAWVYCTQNVSTYNMFMGDYLPYFGFYGGSTLYFSNIVGGSQQTFSGGSLSLNTWYQAVFTTAYNGTNTPAVIYANGVQVASATFTGQQGAPNGTFTIGDGQSMATWYPFKGNIGSVKIYNRALSQAEVLQNFNALRGRYGI